MESLAFVFYLIVIIPSSILHEYAHGWMAERLGDSTARYAGRLTLDPRAHIDLMGTIVLPLILLISTGGRFMFAYAKPVPYNPYNLRNQQWGPALVGFAGPAANFILALGFALLIRLLTFTQWVPAWPAAFLLSQVVYANLTLMVFNLVPLPPLDGSKILYSGLPKSAENVKRFLDRYGTILLFISIFFLFDWISPIIQALFLLLVG